MILSSGHLYSIRPISALLLSFIVCGFTFGQEAEPTKSQEERVLDLLETNSFAHVFSKEEWSDLRSHLAVVESFNIGRGGLKTRIETRPDILELLLDREKQRNPYYREIAPGATGPKWDLFVQRFDQGPLHEESGEKDSTSSLWNPGAHTENVEFVHWFSATTVTSPAESVYIKKVYKDSETVVAFVLTAMTDGGHFPIEEKRNLIHSLKGVEK